MVDQKALIVALDYDDMRSVLQLTEQLDPSVCRVKVGKQLFTRVGPTAVEQLVNQGFDVFLDLKFHDIPNTVAQAVVAAADLGVWMVNVHASGGLRMMQAAREAVASASQPPLLIGVTVLTSMAREDLAELHWDAEPIDRVCELALLAAASGLDGVVCSAAEASVLSRQHSPDFLLVTPGIRQQGDAAGDQRRIVTPSDAVAAGASHLVVGRSITASLNPAATVAQIRASLEADQSNTECS